MVGKDLLLVCKRRWEAIAGFFIVLNARTVLLVFHAWFWWNQDDACRWLSIRLLLRTQLQCLDHHLRQRRSSTYNNRSLQLCSHAHEPSAGLSFAYVPRTHFTPSRTHFTPSFIAGWRQNRPLPLILPLFLLTCLFVTAFLRRRTGPVGSIMPCLPVLGSPQRLTVLVVNFFKTCIN